MKRKTMTAWTFDGSYVNKNLLDALYYAQETDQPCKRVKMSGNLFVAHLDDLITASKQEVLATAEIGPLLHQWACDLAEASLRTIKEEDKVIWEVIKIKRQWCEGKEVSSALQEAREEARVAGWNNFEKPRSCAWGAVWESGKEDPCGAAWGTARGSAWQIMALRGRPFDVIWDSLNKDLETKVLNYMGFIQ